MGWWGSERALGSRCAVPSHPPRHPELPAGLGPGADAGSPCGTQAGALGRGQLGLGPSLPGWRPPSHPMSEGASGVLPWRPSPWVRGVSSAEAPADWQVRRGLLCPPPPGCVAQALLCSSVKWVTGSREGLPSQGLPSGSWQGGAGAGGCEEGMGAGPPGGRVALEGRFLGQLLAGPSRGPALPPDRWAAPRPGALSWTPPHPCTWPGDAAALGCRTELVTVGVGEGPPPALRQAAVPDPWGPARWPPPALPGGPGHAQPRVPGVRSVPVPREGGERGGGCVFSLQPP